jgi:hypothetical protein
LSIPHETRTNLGDKENIDEDYEVNREGRLHQRKVSNSRVSSKGEVAID